MIHIVALAGFSIWGPYIILGKIIAGGGWLILAGAFLIGFWWWYMITNQLRYDHGIPRILLAIDVPRENEQSPKAVEHIFSQLHGIKKSGNNLDKYWYGYAQVGFSLELISIDGYIQYLIDTPVKYRDLVEAAIYAQYPDAEITEAEDYAKNIPVDYPDDEYNMWGTEFELNKEEVYPIRTYPEFEHSLSQEYKDPMAGLLELLSRLQAGEQFWIQILITPAGSSWREEGKEVIRHLIGAKSSKKKKEDLGWLASHVTHGVVESFTASLIPPTDLGAAGSASEEENRWPTLMQHLSPDERSVVEAVGYKLAKLGFETKLRFVYLTKKGVTTDQNRQQAMMGAFKQFNSQDLNGFGEDKKTRTKVVYPPIKSILDWRLKHRQKKIMLGYKGRSQHRGRNNFVLNIEELASIWHFPVLTVKAPLVQKTESKRAEPPSALPLEQVSTISSAPRDREAAPEPVETKPSGQPPANIPIVE